ncbi:MAG TPA: outer membrane protein assembly factor BamA [Candidatus Polarisedimenticolaceae bacterium]|nr:outer membrane protein assembly factor BamA [Candidatus Polarisedimenticolaceae bacterium]
MSGPAPDVEGPAAPRRRRWGRAAAILGALCLLLLAAALVAAARLDAWARRALEGKASTALGGTVRVQELHVELLALRARFSGLSLTLPAPGAPPLRAGAAGGTVALAWPALLDLAGGRYRLAELTLEQPYLEVTEEFLRAWRRPTRERADVAWRVDRLELRGGRLRFDDREVPLSLAVSDLDARGAWAVSREALSGELGVVCSVDRTPFARPYPVRVRTGFRLHGTALDLFQLRAEAAGLGAEGALRVGLADGVVAAGSFRATGDLAAVRAWMTPDMPALAGKVSGLFVLDARAGTFHLRGPVSGEGLVVGPLQVAWAQGQASVHPGAFDLARLQARAYGGNLTGLLGVTFGPALRFRTNLTGQGLDATPLLQLAELPLPLAASLDAGLLLEGAPGSPATWSGHGRLLARPRRGGTGVATGATGTFDLRDGKLRVSGARVQAAEADLRLDLSADLGAHPVRGTVVLEGSTRDAAATQRGALTLLAALGVDPGELARRPISGAGPVRVRTVLGGAPELDLALALDTGEWSGHPFQHAALQMALRGTELRIERVAAEGPLGKLEGGVALSTGEASPRSLHFQVQDADLALLQEVVPLPVNPGGRVTGELALDGGRGGGRLVLEGAELYGERVDRAEAEVAVDGSTWTFTAVDVVGPAGHVQGSARLDVDTGTMDLQLDRVEVALAGVAALQAAGIAVSGTLDLQGSVHLAEAGPTGELHVRNVAGNVSGFALAETTGRVDLFPDHLQVSLASPEDRTWRLQGTLGFSEDLPVEGTLEVQDASFDLPSTGSLAAWVLASGQVSVRGPLARPAALSAEGVVQGAELHLGTALLQTVAPVPLSLRDGRLRLDEVRLEGTGSSLVASLGLDLEQQTVELTSRGSVDLGVVSAFIDNVRAGGALQADLRLAGPLDAPRLSGSFSMQGGRLRIVGFPQAFEGIALTASVDDTKATLSSFTARLGGGEVAMSGSATLSGFAPTDYALEATGTRVRLTYPEGFTGIYSGELALRGSAEQARLSGEVRLVRGVYSKDVELASLLGFGSREYAGTDAELLPDNVFLDVDVKSDGNVWMRNDLIHVEARLDLHVGGELVQPELTGRIELFEDGKLTFRDVDYRIRRGSLEFMDLERINPFLELTAETHVEDYDITLHLEGTLDDFEYRLTSAPTLSEQDIVSLLLTGQTLTELGESGKDVGTAATSDMAANYFAGALTGRFTSEIQRAFGLEKLRVDPMLVQGQADPTARVTVGKRVAEDLLLIYSTDLGATERDFYQAEWQASRNYRVTAEREQNGGSGGSVQYSDRFFWRKPKTLSPPDADGVDGAEGAGANVVAVEIEGEVLGDERPLRRRLRVEAGKPYRRSDLFDGMEQIRRWYVRRGRIQAEVEGNVEDVAGGVRLRYTVKPGPEVPLHIEGVSRRERRNLRQRLQDYWVDTLYNEDLYRDSVDLARRFLQERGFYAADVQLLDRREAGQGITLQIDKGAAVKVREVVIEGLATVPEARVRKQVLTRADTLFSRGLLKADVLEEDLVAVRNLLRDLGHLDATVEPPRVSLSADGSEATVTIRVHEGITYKVGAVAFSPGLPFSEEQLRAWTPMAPGDVFSPARVLSAQTALRNQIDSLGYPDARVRPQPTRKDGVVDVRFDVTSGKQKTLARVEVSGNRRTKGKIVTRELELKEGQPLSREEMLRAQHRLYRMGLFSSVRMETIPVAGAAGPHVLRVRVEEAPPLDITVGAGYDTESGPRVQFSVADANVGGYDRRLGLQTRWSGKEKRVQLLAEEPRLFSRNVDLLSIVQWEDVEQTGFSNDRWSTSVRLEQKFKPHWTRYLKYTYQRNDTYDVVDPLELLEQRIAEDTRLGDVGFSMVRDTRDDPFLPTKGSQAIGELRVFAEPLVSDANFVKLSLRGAKVWTYPSQTQFATSLRIGTEWTYSGTEDVPIPERFFAGGESTLRGFERDEAGPQAEGVPIGGEALIVANQELRVPIWRQLKGVVFYDAGNAFLKPADFRWSEIRHVLGAGIRVDTPIGPLRVEYGHKLDRKEGESAGEIFIAFGNAF